MRGTMVRSRVNPYRAHELRRPTHALGSDRARRLKVLGGLAVIVVNVVVFLWVAANATNVNVIFFGPTIFGALLLVQARAGSIVLHPEERAGEIVVQCERARNRAGRSECVPRREWAAGAPLGQPLKAGGFSSARGRRDGVLTRGTRVAARRRRRRGPAR